MEDLLFGGRELPSDVEEEIVARPVAKLSRATDKKVSVIRTSVGRLGLDPSTLRVFPERPGTSITVQICWPYEVQRPPTSTEVHSRLFSWLDNLLDLGSFQGHVTVRFRMTDGELSELRLGEE